VNSSRNIHKTAQDFPAHYVEAKKTKSFAFTPEIKETEEFLKIAYANSFHRFFAFIFCFVKTSRQLSK
jgi:hypothetical protein